MALLPTNQRDQILMIVCLLAGGLIYAYYSFMYSGKKTELDFLQARLDTLHEQNEIARREIARGNATKLRQEAEEYGRMLGLMRHLVPTANEVPTLLDQISTSARRAGLELSEVTPLGVIGGDVFDTYRYKIGVTGSYHRIAQLLTNVGGLTRIVAPMNLTLTPTTKPNQVNRPGEATLDAGFEVQTYVAKVSAPPPPQTQ